MPDRPIVMRATAPRALAAALAVTALAGCALPQPGKVVPGQDEAEVITLMGQPTGRYVMPSGAVRLEFARGPAGRETWMVDLDVQGRVTAREQVLDVRHFLAVTDDMSQDALRRSLGRPARVQREHAARQTWFWRYANNDCLIAAATLSAEGRVMGGVALLPDQDCEVRRR